MRALLPKWCGIALLCALSLLAVHAPAPARAERALLTEEAVNPEKAPEGQIEGACGVAVAGRIYVSDYYRHAVDVFGGGFEAIPAGDSPEGPCGLAIDSEGALYANLWHERVVRLRPTEMVFDTAESTGVAVDGAVKGASDVYVDDRTYVAVYEPSGTPVLEKGQPLQIGLGTLGDAYGLAVFEGKVYVPDAADRTVKVYRPSVDPLHPELTIGGGFTSLVDAAVAIDPTNGHLLVLDNQQPGYEHPKAAIDEFDSSGAFLGQLSKTGSGFDGRLIDGEPSGLAVDSAGLLYATSGNSERSNVFVFGAFTDSPLQVEVPVGAPMSVSTSTDRDRVPGPPAPLAALPTRRPIRHPRHRHRARRLAQLWPAKAISRR